MNSNPEMLAEIRECESRLYAAVLASDVEELGELIADDLVFVDQSGQIATKAMDLELHRSKTLKVTTMEPVEQQIICLADAAVAIVRISLVGTYHGEAFAGDYRYTRIWQKTENGWQIIAGQFCPVA